MPAHRDDGRDAISGAADLNFWAGFYSSGLVLAALFPLDAIKTHAQTNHADGYFASLRWQGSWGSTIARVYRGFFPAIFEHSINRGMMFAVATKIKDATPKTWSEPARDATSGGGAAVIKTVLLHPLDTVKTRWQLGQPGWGLTGLYNGVVPAIARSSPGMAIWLATRNYLSRELPEGWVSDTARHGIVGMMSSVITDMCTFPFDTLKKTMQAEAAKGRSPSVRELLGVAMASDLLATGGFRRFFYGYSARLSIVAAKGCIDNTTYVWVKRLLQEGRDG
jgi:hypothetical protein